MDPLIMKLFFDGDDGKTSLSLFFSCYIGYDR